MSIKNTILRGVALANTSGRLFYKYRDGIYAMNETPLHVVVEPEFEFIQHEHRVYPSSVLYDEKLVTIDVLFCRDTGAYMYVHNNLYYDIRFPLQHAVAPPKQSVTPPKQTVAPPKQSVAPPKQTGPEECADCFMLGYVNGVFVRMCVECSKICCTARSTDLSGREIGYIVNRERKLSLIHPDMLDECDSSSNWLITDIC